MGAHSTSVVNKGVQSFKTQFQVTDLSLTRSLLEFRNKME